MSRWAGFSRGVVGAIGTLAVLLTAIGIQVSQDEIALMTGGVLALGGAVTTVLSIYGRAKASGKIHFIPFLGKK